MNLNSDVLSLSPVRALKSSFAEQLIWNRLRRLQNGQLDVSYQGRTMQFGQVAHDGLHARISVLDGDVFRRILFGGTLAASECYADGLWLTDDLTKVIRVFARNSQFLEQFDLGASKVGQWFARLGHSTRKNTHQGSRRNIAEHYDLGNDFFQWMLDPTMTYSAAIFENATDNLEQASTYKLDLLCQKLDLKPEDHLLEIGTGWGSLAIHAAANYGCRVTTTTLSKEQRALALERIRARGLQDKVEVLDQDYRDLKGTYDKIVSCEMIEAVGREYYPVFYQKCSSLLKPQGKLAMQAITIQDQKFERASNEVDFIKQYIFPGSCIPSATALLTAATASSDLVLKKFDDYTPHYARTMVEWRRNISAHNTDVISRFGERFWKTWSYYLSYCEAGFEERTIGVAHLVFERSASV